MVQIVFYGLGSERQWLKFSYVWFASPDEPSELPKAEMRRVISDPLGTGLGQKTVLLCEPEVSKRWSIGPQEKIHRGALISAIEKPSVIKKIAPKPIVKKFRR